MMERGLTTGSLGGRLRELRCATSEVLKVSLAAGLDAQRALED